MKKLLIILSVLCAVYNTYAQSTDTTFMTNSIRSGYSITYPYKSEATGRVIFNRLTDSTYQIEIEGDTISAINTLLCMMHEYEEKYYAADDCLNGVAFQLIASGNEKYITQAYAEDTKKRYNRYTKLLTKYQMIYKKIRPIQYHHNH